MIQLRPWPLGPAPAGQDSTPGISGDLVEVAYLPDGDPYVLTVTQQETHQWEHSIARSVSLTSAPRADAVEAAEHQQRPQSERER